MLAINNDDYKDVAAVIDDICNTVHMIDAKREYIKEAKLALKEKYDLTPSEITLMVKLHTTQTATEHFHAQFELQELYGNIFPTSKESES